MLDVLRQLEIPLPTDGSLPTKRWLITRWLAPDFHTVIRRTSGSAQQLVRSLISRFELENVKYAVRTLAAREPVRTEAFLDLGKVATVNPGALEGIRQTSDLHAAVSGTLFAAPLQQGRTSNLEEEGSAFAMESMLDRVVYAALRKAAEAFRGPGAVRIRRLVTRLADTVSLLWLLRYRQVYGLAPEAAAGLSMIHPSPLTVEFMRQMSQAATFEEFQSAMRAASPMERWRDGERPVEWERRFWERILNTARTMLYGAPFDFSVAIGFLFLKEGAIRNIALICQGRDVGLPAKALEQALLSIGASTVRQEGAQ